jgi:ABC-type branched-subunit amino acid transport system ATPase component
MLDVQHLCKSFGGVKAADDITLDFADGSLTPPSSVPMAREKHGFFNLITGALRPDPARSCSTASIWRDGRRPISCATASAAPSGWRAFSVADGA